MPQWVMSQLFRDLEGDRGGDRFKVVVNKGGHDNHKASLRPKIAEKTVNLLGVSKIKVKASLVSYHDCMLISLRFLIHHSA